MGTGATRDSTDRLHAGLLALLVVGGVIARATLMREPMRYDEAFTFYTYATASVGHIVSTYDLPNNHVLYTLLTHFSWRVLGDHVWVVRLPALLAGVALVPATYLAGRALYSRSAGLLAAAMVAGLTQLIDYSVDGRGYTLGVLLIVLSLWIAARLLERPRREDWAALIVLFALAVYTVPTMAYGVATVAAWMGGSALLRRDGRGVALLLLRLTAALVVAGLLSLLLYSALLGQAGWTFVDPVRTAWQPLWFLAGKVWQSWMRATPHPLDWVLALAFLAGFALHRRIARQPLPIGLAGVAVVLLVVAAGQVSPFRRTYLYLLPLATIQASAALAYAASRLAPRVRHPALAGAVAIVCAAGALAGLTLYAGPGGADQPPVTDNDMVGLLQRYTGPHEAVLLEQRHLAPPADYYLRRSRYRPAGLPPHREPYRALVVVPRGRFRESFDLSERPRPISPYKVVRDVGWAVRPGTRPRLVVTRRYLRIYRMEIE